MLTKVLTNWFFYALLGLFVVFLYGPMFGIILLSFQGPDGGLTFPMNGVSLHWIGDLFQEQRVGDFQGSFSRSLFLGLLVSFLTTAFSYAAGLAFRARFPAREKLLDFLRGNYHQDCSFSPHECTNAKPETHEATKHDESVVGEKEDNIFALAPGATHIAAACGSRFVISATALAF